MSSLIKEISNFGLPEAEWTAISGRVSVLGDYLSAMRNSFNACQQDGTRVAYIATALKIATLVPAMFIIGGMLGLWVSGRMTWRAIQAFSEPDANGNETWNGIYRLRHWLLFSAGLTYGVVAAAMVAFGIATFAAEGATAVAGALATLVVFVPAFYVVLGLISVYQFGRAVTFRMEFEEMVQKWQDGDKGLLVEWIRGIGGDSETSDWVASNLQGGATGGCFQLLQRVPIADEYSNEMGEYIIAEVRRANNKYMLNQGIGAVIAVLGLAASFTPGAPASILFAVTAVVWLLVDSGDLNQWVGEKCFGKMGMGERAQDVVMYGTDRMQAEAMHETDRRQQVAMHETDWTQTVAMHETDRMQAEAMQQTVRGRMQEICGMDWSANFREQSKVGEGAQADISTLARDMQRVHYRLVIGTEQWSSSSMEGLETMLVSSTIQNSIHGIYRMSQQEIADGWRAMITDTLQYYGWKENAIAQVLDGCHQGTWAPMAACMNKPPNVKLNTHDGGQPQAVVCVIEQEQVKIVHYYCRQDAQLTYMNGDRESPNENAIGKVPYQLTLTGIFARTGCTSLRLNATELDKGVDHRHLEWRDMLDIVSVLAQHQESERKSPAQQAGQVSSSSSSSSSIANVGSDEENRPLLMGSSSRSSSDRDSVGSDDDDDDYDRRLQSIWPSLQSSRSDGAAAAMLRQQTGQGSSSSSSQSGQDEGRYSPSLPSLVSRNSGDDVPSIASEGGDDESETAPLLQAHSSDNGGGAAWQLGLSSIIGSWWRRSPENDDHHSDTSSIRSQDFFFSAEGRSRTPSKTGDVNDDVSEKTPLLEGSSSSSAGAAAMTPSSSSSGRGKATAAQVEAAAEQYARERQQQAAQAVATTATQQSQRDGGGSGGAAAATVATTPRRQGRANQDVKSTVRNMVSSYVDFNSLREESPSVGRKRRVRTSSSSSSR